MLKILSFSCFLAVIFILILLLKHEKRTHFVVFKFELAFLLAKLPWPKHVRNVYNSKIFLNIFFSFRAQSKRRRIEKCIIHCSDETSDKLTSPQDVDSWRSLLSAAIIRQHQPLLELAKTIGENEYPQSIITGNAAAYSQ